MTLFLRSVQVLLRYLFSPRLSSLSEPFVHSFRVMPFDLDILRHMNNARYLNYMESTRWGLQLRTGFLRLAREKKWAAPLSHIEIRFLRPLKLFQKFSVSAQLVRIDGKVVHIYQEFRSNQKKAAEALVTVMVRSAQGVVTPEEYLPALGYEKSQVQCPESVAAWLATFAG